MSQKRLCSATSMHRSTLQEIRSYSLQCQELTLSICLSESYAAILKIGIQLLVLARFKLVMVNPHCKSLRKFTSGLQGFWCTGISELQGLHVEWYCLKQSLKLCLQILQVVHAVKMLLKNLTQGKAYKSYDAGKRNNHRQKFIMIM